MIPKGFRFAGARCGLKNKRNDIGLIVSETPSKAAGLFTQNQVRAACVDYSREALQGGELQCIVVNSGNANCCTGEQGVRDTARMALLAADALGIPASSIAVASTGVIGQLLQMPKVEKGIAEAATKLGEDPRPFMDAILTTDLVEKWAFAVIREDEIVFSDVNREAAPLGSDQEPTPSTPLSALTLLSPAGPALAPQFVSESVSGDGTIYGVCKGSGMIAPNMATMLAFVVTDFDTSDLDLHAALEEANSKSFNCLTVDGDTSTNDMILILANGASGVRPSAEQFQIALERVCTSLAKQIARDGEGATKLVEVRVTGSVDPKKIALSIANSPLVKTAMFGCDPNWGRVMMAAGHAGVAFDPAQATLTVCSNGEEHTLFEAGSPAAFDAKRVSTSLKSGHVILELLFGEGETARVFTCDFGYGYVRINAEYHT